MMIRGAQGTLIAERYEFVSVLGEGAMASVYKAHDRALGGEPVALKIIHRNLITQGQWLDRFKQEVVVARRLSHPNIVRIFDFGELPEGDYFATMEIVAGGNLKSKIESTAYGRLELIDSLQILLQTTMALDYAHQHAVIHRDVKPDNILFDLSGFAKLSDFGSARQLELDQRLTPLGNVIGTPHYMPPELFKGEPATPLVDVYSLGIVLYEMLAGSPPFVGESSAAVIAQHIKTSLPPLSTRRSDVPKWCEEIIQTCTEKRPGDRYPSISALAGEVLDRLVSLDAVPKLPAIPDSLVHRIKGRNGSGGSLLKRLFS